MIDIAALRGEVNAQNETARVLYAEHGDAKRLLQWRCTQVDEVLSRLWHDLHFPNTLALVAIGGYGRGELFPASDVDLLILLPKAPSEALQAKLETLVGYFWDIGLEIGHSVRTVEDCLTEARNDITVQTALVEARQLCGSEPLFQRLQQVLRSDFHPLSFFNAKCQEQQERHLRYNESPYSLEPNCKESPGGLRDLHVIFWVARAADYGTSWQDLAHHGLITDDEAERFTAAEDFLDHLRIRLHFLTKRREDRLLFDYQNQLAETFGHTGSEGKRASEELMQRYYRTAKAVTLLNTILLQNIGEALDPSDSLRPEIIDENFRAIDDLLDVRDEELFAKNPELILDSFLVMQERHDLRSMTARTLRALWRARTLITDEFRAQPSNRQTFLKLLQSPQGIVHEFRRMNQLDILGAYLPAFGRIVGQMQHDLFHVYTVDQHILQVMRNVRRFTMPEFAHEYPLCSRLINDFDRHWILYVAALFHDIAKGRGGDHSEKGRVDAREFCVEHELLEEDTELVEWLVGNHLLMSKIAQKEDTSDPEVISSFTEVVKDERHLTALYLLTHADIRGTSPKVWNQWKGKLLADLFQTTLHALTHGEPPGRQGTVTQRQDEAMRLLRYFALSDTVHERLWKQLDTVYFLRHSAEEIAWHTRALHYLFTNDQPIVRARPSPVGDGLQVMIYSPDELNLFTRILAFFARTGYSIVDAKIHTTKHGYALDSFVLLDLEGRGHQREMITYVEHELAQCLVRRNEPDAPSGGRLSRQVRHFPIKPRIDIKPDERGSNYILSLVAADRPGLLYQVAMILAKHGVNLHTAKVATLGERAEDVFLISGGDLGQSGRRIQLEQELRELLTV